MKLTIKMYMSDQVSQVITGANDGQVSSRVQVMTVGPGIVPLPYIFLFHVVALSLDLVVRLWTVTLGNPRTTDTRVVSLAISVLVTTSQH